MNGPRLVSLWILVAACAAGNSRPQESRSGDVLRVAEVLDSPAVRAGDTVKVVGKCLGYGTVMALGPPPVTRSDWQLEGDGRAIWVTGSFPSGCSALGNGPDSVHAFARVAVDTVQALGGAKTAERRYLYYLSPDDS